MKRNWLDRTERFFVALIQAPHPDKSRPRAQRILLAVLRALSHVYKAVVQLRLFLYGKGVFRHHTLGCQVISIGNLTVGGTGKTPVVEIFARELQKAGRKVAVLSRGYKSAKAPLLQRIFDVLTFREWRRPPRVVSDGRNLLLDAATSGDEPYMLASNLPGVCVLVDKNRVKSGRYAIRKLKCDTLVLDDGFQYLTLRHRMEIVLVDKTNPFGNMNVLPRGILRESVKNIKRADFIFITKSDGQGAEPLKELLRKYNSKAEIIECRHCPRDLREVYTRSSMALDRLRVLPVAAMSGIAAPEGFEAELERRGARLVRRFRFADHHMYTLQELIDILNDAKAGGAQAVITTEKDAVRLPFLERCDIPIYFLRVDIEIISGAQDFHECISRICFRNARQEPAHTSSQYEQERATA